VKQAESLKNEADFLLANDCLLGLTETIHCDPVDEDGSFVGCQQASKQRQQGSFAAARGTHHQGKSSLFDRQGNIAKRADTSLPLSE
jgi:hypothetical protein